MTETGAVSADAASDADRQTRLDRWEDATEWPLAVAALVFLGAYAWPILDVHLGHGWHRLCHVVTDVVWVLFIVEYIGRLILSPKRWEYFWHHLLDLAVLALPFLRPLRLIALLEILNRRAADSLHGRLVVYVTGATALLVFCSSLAVLDAERGHHAANIENFGDALWWSATTITTVGYGDHFPVTTTGRFVAVGLMIGGVALLGVVTASLASWLIGRVKQTEDEAQAATQADVAALAAEVRELKAMLAARIERAESG